MPVDDKRKIGEMEAIHLELRAVARSLVIAPPWMRHLCRNGLVYRLARLAAWFVDAYLHEGGYWIEVRTVPTCDSETGIKAGNEPVGGLYASLGLVYNGITSSSGKRILGYAHDPFAKVRDYAWVHDGELPPGRCLLFRKEMVRR